MPLKYNVKIIKVEEQILPELDDNLAKSVNKNFSNMIDLENHIKQDLQNTLDKDHQELIKKEIINYFIEKTKVDAPESMVSIYLKQLKEDFEKQKQSINEEEFYKNYEPQAKWNIKWYLIKDKIIEKISSS